MDIPDAARAVLNAPLPATLATLDPDGRAHLSTAWIGLDDDDEIVIGTIPDQRKLHNIRRDPRVTLSIVTDKRNRWGLHEYLVVYGRARVTEGGGSEVLRELAAGYIGPGVEFPPPGSPPGFVTRIAIERFGGVGPWSSVS